MLAVIRYQQLFQNSYLNLELNSLLLFIIIEMMEKRGRNTSKTHAHTAININLKVTVCMRVFISNIYISRI